MKDILIKQIKSVSARPMQPSGSVRIAGERVAISRETVGRKSGSSPKVILRSLKEVARRSLFPFPVSIMNE